MKALAYIFARGGSKGVKRKNLRIINGKSLLQRAIETAQNTRRVTDVIVSTEDSEIAAHALECGAIVPFVRPLALATDNASEWLAWRHAAQKMTDAKRVDPNTLFVSVPTTTPLKTSKELNHCLDLYESEGSDMVVTGYESNHHPSFNMVKYEQGKKIELIAKSDKLISGRQLTSYKAYNLTTVCYVTNHRFVLEANGVLDGVTSMFEVDQAVALDIDTEFDLEFASYMLTNRETNLL